MAWSRTPRGPHRRGYHHGNLREALVAEALHIIAEKGPEGVTLAEAARMAGVSPAAPYRHFADRSSLMAAVAHEGYTRFADALTKAWKRGSGTPLEAILRIGRAYLEFARKESALFAAMFEAGIAPSADPQLSREADRAFYVLKDACGDLHDTLPEDRRAPALMIALHIWSMAHGIAALFGRGDAAGRAIPVSPEELLEAGILIYLDGLGHSGKT
jgi:AcrR family transcriptional regulator